MIRAMALLALALSAAVPVDAGQGGPAPGRVLAASKIGRGEAFRGESQIANVERVIVDLINAERGARGLPSLVVSPELARLARQYSRDMAERRYFAHVDPEGKRVGARVDEACGIAWTSVGENIARNRGFDDPAGVAVREWMRSEGHRENILSGKFRETGIGVWVGPDDTVYFTQIFLTRRPEAGAKRH
jgi:uncharacterized protein YkwD